MNRYLLTFIVVVVGLMIFSATVERSRVEPPETIRDAIQQSDDPELKQLEEDCKKLAEGELEPATSLEELGDSAVNAITCAILDAKLEDIQNE